MVKKPEVFAASEALHATMCQTVIRREELRREGNTGIRPMNDEDKNILRLAQDNLALAWLGARAIGAITDEQLNSIVIPRSLAEADLDAKLDKYKLHRQAIEAPWLSSPSTMDFDLFVPNQLTMLGRIIENEGLPKIRSNKDFVDPQESAEATLNTYLIRLTRAESWFRL